MSTSRIKLRRIVSGGQSGGDQGGLAAGVTLGLETGGWIPRGWRTEKGSEPWLAELGLKEHRSSSYPPRTKLNVKDSDGTLWLGNSRSRGGQLTLRTAQSMGKPDFVVQIGMEYDPEERAAFREWLEENDIETLNVAGNRESSRPGIAQATHDFIVSSVRGE
jgi:hypothetical protein